MAVQLAHRRGAAPGPGAWGLALALAWFAVPVAITFVYSLIAQPLFQPRNLLMSCRAAVALLLARRTRGTRGCRGCWRAARWWR